MTTHSGAAGAKARFADDNLRPAFVMPETATITVGGRVLAFLPVMAPVTKQHWIAS